MGDKPISHKSDSKPKQAVLPYWSMILQVSGTTLSNDDNAIASLGGLESAFDQHATEAWPLDGSPPGTEQRCFRQFSAPSRLGVPGYQTLFPNEIHSEDEMDDSGWTVEYLYEQLVTIGWVQDVFDEVAQNLTFDIGIESKNENLLIQGQNRKPRQNLH